MTSSAATNNRLPIRCLPELIYSVAPVGYIENHARAWHMAGESTL